MPGLDPGIWFHSAQDPRIKSGDDVILYVLAGALVCKASA
jgi:hypothetical protein